MDFNDIKVRLERTLSSLNARFEPAIPENIDVKVVYSDNFRSAFANFGHDDESDVLNKIFIILYNLASLKDHLQNCLFNKGYKKQIVEDEIDNSLHLQVLTDLVNQEKHGYPLTKRRRSLKDPIIKNPMKFLSLSVSEPDSVAAFSLSFDGSYQILGENNKIVISAEICDSNGNQLFILDELVGTCFEKWENLAKAYHCI
jgi:hypothetical protein